MIMVCGSRNDKIVMTSRRSRTVVDLTLHHTTLCWSRGLRSRFVRSVLVVWWRVTLDELHSIIIGLTPLQSVGS
jgi:hypothetical protein